MKLIEREHLKAIHQMAEANFEWEHNNGYNWIVHCKLYYDKPKGYAKFKKTPITDDKYGIVIHDFEKLNEYYPMEITDGWWDILLVGYDLFLKSNGKEQHESNKS